MHHFPTMDLVLLMVKRGWSSHHQIAKCWVHKLTRGQTFLRKKANVAVFQFLICPHVFPHTVLLFPRWLLSNFLSYFSGQEMCFRLQTTGHTTSLAERNCVECGLQLSFRIQTTLQIKVHVSHWFIFLLVLKELVPNIDLWVWLFWEEKRNAFSLTFIDLCL